MEHIFISYSRADAEYAQSLEDRLRSKGFRVWRDHHSVRAGDNWWRVIKENLVTSSAVIILMSDVAAQSAWVMRETAIADYLDKPVFPLFLGGDINHDAWSIYKMINYMDVQDHSLPDDIFYEDLGRFVPRIVLAGGVRLDGLYVCQSEHFHDALRFYEDDFVSSFIFAPETDITSMIGKQEARYYYTINQKQKIHFESESRSYACTKTEEGLRVQVNATSNRKPRGATPNHRTYTFIPFTD